MSTYPAIERQSIIKDYINGIYRTKDEIIGRLEESDIVISKKTLERDFNSLEQLGYEIENVRGRGYILKHSQEFTNELLNRFNRITKLNKIMKETELSDFVLDSSVQMKGIDLIPEIFKGLQEHRYIVFDYRKHGESEYSHRTVIPLWLKEDKDFWYLIALPDGESEIRTFGLDRIQTLELGNAFDESQINSTVTEQVDDLKYRLGISYPTFLENPKREIIKLAVSDFLLPYWKSKPVHPTQRITNEKNKQKSKIK